MRGLPCVKTSEGFHLYQLMLPQGCLEGGILAPHLLSELNPQWVHCMHYLFTHSAIRKQLCNKCLKAKLRGQRL